jgi:hypothetical protein
VLTTTDGVGDKGEEAKDHDEEEEEAKEEEEGEEENDHTDDGALPLLQVILDLKSKIRRQQAESNMSVTELKHRLDDKQRKVSRNPLSLAA